MKSRKKAPIATSENAASSSRIQDRPSTGPTEEQIRLRAYKIYVERGRADGQDREDRIRDEKELTIRVQFLPTWRMRKPACFVILVPEGNMSSWSELSNELHKTVQAVGQSVIMVQAESSRTVSGIVLDERTIVTTASAIGDGETIRAWVSPDQQVDARIIGSDRGTDIALLKPDQQVGSPAVFADDPKLEVGHLVLAIGRTWRGNLVASSGILSGLMGEWRGAVPHYLNSAAHPIFTTHHDQWATSLTTTS